MRRQLQVSFLNSFAIEVAFGESLNDAQHAGNLEVYG